VPYRNRRTEFLAGNKLGEDGLHPEPSASTAALVNLVTELGPDVAEISRRLGQYKETVRYRYKEKLVKRGFQIKADVDYGALGLRRIVMKVRFARSHAQEAHAIFKSMSEECFLVAFAGTLPGDLYIAHAGVPAEFIEEFHALTSELKEKGVFSSVETFDCDWFRVAPMRAECFDFDEGVWDFDWRNPPQANDKAARATVTERKDFDKVDLLLLKELWKDSDRSLKEIHEAIEELNGEDLNYKTLGWHLKKHVVGRHLIRDYSVAWHGMKYDSNLQRTERVGKYSYLGVSIIVRETSSQEKMVLRSQLNRLPFQWSEAAGDSYYSQLFFPLGMVNEALENLKTLLLPYGERAELFLLDRREMTSFTIGYKKWDEENGRWTFDRAAVVPRILESSLLSLGRRNV